MKILRSTTRRGTEVRTAGYYTVLQPSAWFAAARLSDRFPHLRERAAAAVAARLASEAATGSIDFSTNCAEVHLDLRPEPEPIHWMRSALILLVAFGVTSWLLWWLFGRPHPTWT